MTIASNKNTPRVAYTATANQLAFTIPFEFFAVTDIKVYNGTTLLTYDANADAVTEYSLTGAASDSDDAYEYGAGGTVTIGANGILNGAVITIIRDIVIERTSDFSPSGLFDITSLNTDLDRVYAKLADLDQHIDRSVKLLDTDSIAANMALPAKATRASKVMAFASDGTIDVSNSTVSVATIAAIASDVTAVSNIASDVAAVQDIAANVTSVAGIASNVTSVAGIASNVTTVAGIASNVTSVAGIASNVTTVAGNIAGVNSFADRYRVTSGDPDSSLNAGDLNFNTSSNTFKYYSGSAWASVAATDSNIKVSSNDSSAGGLLAKLTATGSTGVTLTETNNGSNETLNITLAGIPIAKLAASAITINGSAVSLGGSVTIGETKPTVANVSQTIAPSSATTINITGSNFVTVPIVEFIKTDGAITRPNSVSFTNATTLSVNVTLATGAYHVRIENPDGNAGRSTNNIITASAAPTFSTSTGSIGSVSAGASVSIDVDGSSDSTVAFSETTSVLTSNANTPAATMNLTLNSGTGVITGTAPSPSASTTYNFTLRLTDAESQTVDRAFSITIEVGMANSGQFNNEQ
jgi:hypothetical protein